VSNLTLTTAQYAAMRGLGHQKYGIIGIFAYLFTNIAPVFGALLFDAGTKLLKKSLLVILSFGPAVYCMLTQSSKIVMLTSIILFIATLLLVKVYSGKLGLFRVSVVLKSLLGALVLIPLVLYSLLARGGCVSFANFKETAGGLAYGLSSYLLGQVYAFSDFFNCYLGLKSSQLYKNDYNSHGYYTFKAIFDSFGGKKVFPPGYYDESFASLPYFQTNLFTVFRSLIYDFGWAGTLLVFLLGGYVVHYFYNRLLLNDRPWFSCVVFVVSTVAIFMSYLFSIFTSRYISFVGAVLFLVLYLNDKYSCKVAAKSNAENP
jgi:oligosaccharide repeat unit polymerase